MTQSVTILQARTGSTRLAGKALLPVAGYPSAILAALRAGNMGDQVVVAIPDGCEDERLASELIRCGVRVVRGPLEDVLSRFELAAAGLPDECIVVRLTADNVMPDGALTRELVQALAGSGMEYLSQSSPPSRLPYGLGGEAFSARTLRRASAHATSVHDREHVCPWMQRNCRSGIHVPASLQGRDLSHLRCTIDDEEDYRRIQQLFARVSDPLRAPWLELATNLASQPGEPQFRLPYRIARGEVHSELVLGTAQLGMDYGIANRTGRPNRGQAIAMLRQAIAHGVTGVDTARAYGDAESVLAEALAGAWRSRATVITKLWLKSSTTNLPSQGALAAANESVSDSCKALATNHLPVLLLHDWSHYRSCHGAIWQRLLELREEGIIGQLGASVYDPEEALEALDEPELKCLQIPFNVLDWRWKQAGVDRAATARTDVVVHARSALLQGLLANPTSPWPDGDNYDSGTVASKLAHMARKLLRASVTDLCLAYVRSQPWITSVVVGCETPDQLQENLEWFRTPKLSKEECAELEDVLPTAPEALLNPSLWNFAHA